jgi:polysaccharide deacetylase family protein (PEP-CTERM system associated)
MINALSFDIEDWFQVENLKSAISFEDWEHCELRVANNTAKVLNLLDDAGTKATFFILGWIAEKCPSLVREIHARGHEVASHGYSHRLVYEMTREEFREDIIRSKSVLEETIGERILGYRAPCFSITKDSLWALDILKKEGFAYDSSIYPVQFHDRYGLAGCDGEPFRWENGLFEVPLAVYKIGSYMLPLGGGGYFRLFPYFYFKYFLKKINLRKKIFTFYLHPWEFDPGQPRVRVPLGYRFRHYVNLDKTESQLRKLLGEFAFERIAIAYGIEG